MFTKKSFKQHISLLEDHASGEQVAAIGNIIIKNLLKNVEVTFNPQP